MHLRVNNPTSALLALEGIQGLGGSADWHSALVEAFKDSGAASSRNIFLASNYYIEGNQNSTSTYCLS